MTGEEPEAKKGLPSRDVLQRTASVLGVLLLAVVAHRAFTLVPVRVDGRWHRVPAGSPVIRVVEEGWAASSPGDLLSAGHSRVLEAGGGMPVEVYVNGERAAPEARLVAMDVIDTRSGKDLTETVKATYEPMPVPVKTQGSGPLLEALSEGVEGTKLVSRGLVSGEVSEETTVTPPKPALYRRSRLAGGRLVALTFDDGPWPKSTAAVLDVLKKEKVHATFFVIGRQAKRWPALVRREAEEGNVVGNHTYSHKQLSIVSAAVARADIAKGQAATRNILGKPPTLLRPPGGAVNGRVAAECRRQHLSVVMWTIDPQDWRGRNWRYIRGHVVSRIKPGSVILLHDGGGDRSQTVAALGALIRSLKARGYTFVTLDELARARRGKRK